MIRVTNWPSFWSGFADGILLAAGLIAIFAWVAVLPTVGILYFLGALA